MLSKHNIVGWCKLLKDIIEDKQAKAMIKKFLLNYSKDKNFKHSIDEYLFKEPEVYDAVIPNQYLHFIRNMSHYISDGEDMVL